MTSITIKGKKYRLPDGWWLMTPYWLSLLSGIPLEELVPRNGMSNEEYDGKTK